MVLLLAPSPLDLTAQCWHTGSAGQGLQKQINKLLENKDNLLFEYAHHPKDEFIVDT